MAGQDQKLSNEATTTAMITAFADAVSAVESTSTKVSGSRANLVGGWRGAASTKFDAGLGEFMQGLERVKVALNRLDEGMVNFAKLTATSEDERAQQAARAVETSWATRR